MVRLRFVRKAAGAVLRSPLNSFEFRGVFGRRWLHRETVDDRRGGETGLGGWSLVCFIYSSMLGGWTFAPCLRASAACQARRASSRLAATATKACRTEETVAGGHRTCTPTAELPARVSGALPRRASPRGARASSTPTARGPSRGGRGACLPGGEAWGGMMSR